MTDADLKLFAEQLRDLLTRQIPAQPPASLSERRSVAVRDALDQLAREVCARVADYDPARQPTAFFDPSDPLLFGTFVALALTAGQQRMPLAKIADSKFYGSGVYALYYSGSFKLYAPIKRTEHPIYIGAADPQESQARLPREQGTRLWNRLDEHRKNISRTGNLDINHFDCRFLAIQSGWQVSAESALIAVFKPVWNKQVNVLQGFGKHGDSAITRANKRSPWDTLHPGRAWAAGSREDKKDTSSIEQHIQEHFESNPPIKTREDIFARFISSMQMGRHIPLP